MSGNGAFGKDMEKRTDLFVVAVKAAVPERPDPALEGALVRKLATTSRLAAARAAAQPTAPLVAPPAPRRRFGMPVRVALVTGLLIVSTAGLAVAGVKLPAAASTVFDKIGIELPNQSEEASTPPTITLQQPTTGGGTATGTPAAQPQNKGKGKNKNHGNGNGNGNGKGKDKGKHEHKAKPGKPSQGGNGPKPGNGPKASKPPNAHKPTPPKTQKPKAPKPQKAPKQSKQGKGK